MTIEEPSAGVANAAAGMTVGEWLAGITNSCGGYLLKK